MSRELLRAALDALVYHSDQTRPIHSTQMTMDALRSALAQPQAEPVAWKHDCAGLCANDVELWIDACPHCGKPRTAATVPYGHVTTHAVTGQQFFYRHPEPPYLDAAKECIAVYATPQQAEPVDQQVESINAVFDAWRNGEDASLTLGLATPQQAQPIDGFGGNLDSAFDAAPAVQPLTDEQFNDLVMEHLGPHALTGGRISVYDAFLLAVRATERAHGIAAPGSADHG